MSDVVAVALITAGSGLLGVLVTYKVSLRNAEATIATAESQNEVEIAKIEAENSRLRMQYDEDERRNRQATYHRTIAAMQRLHGIEEGSEEWSEVMKEWRFCRSGVQIFGSAEASALLDEVQRVLVRRPNDDGDIAQWQGEFAAAALPFIAAVRVDTGNDRHD
jgi:hypothetical protein